MTHVLSYCITNLGRPFLFLQMLAVWDRFDYSSSNDLNAALTTHSAYEFRLVFKCQICFLIKSPPTTLWWTSYDHVILVSHWHDVSSRKAITSYTSWWMYVGIYLTASESEAQYLFLTIHIHWLTANVHSDISLVGYSVLIPDSTTNHNCGIWD